MTEPVASDTTSWRDRVKRPRVFIPLAILAWLVATVVLGVVTQSSTSCAVCHAMRPYGELHESGRHASAACPDCHRSRTALGALPDGIAMQRRIIAAILQHDVEPDPLHSDEGCRTCHDDALATTVVARGIAVRHADFADAWCVECHGGTGHRRPSRIYARSRMDDCLNCHRTSATDPTGCELCHKEKRADDSPTAWSSMHGVNWRLTHGAGDVEICGSCHPQTYCVRCHGVTMPHPAAWARGHGRLVVIRGRESCRTCHEDPWCAACHGVPMPHAESFIQRHATAASDAADPACVRCHDSGDCQDCHFTAHNELPGVGTPHQELMSE